MQLLIQAQQMLDRLRIIDFSAALLMRLYLAPIFWMAGTQKLAHFEDTVAWFGNPEWGLGLPFPWLMAALAVSTELLGTVLLVLGLAVRWISIPLMATMVVATVTVHLKNGWLAIATGSGLFATEHTEQAIQRLGIIKDILREHGNYGYLTEHGNVVILNNGIEFAATYFIMLLALFALGGGRYLSVDYWLRQRFMPGQSRS